MVTRAAKRAAARSKALVALLGEDDEDAQRIFEAPGQQKKFEAAFARAPKQ